MYRGLSKLLKWIKQNTEITDDEINKILENDYFKEIEARFGKFDEESVNKLISEATFESFAKIEEMDRQLQERGVVPVFDMAKVFLEESRIKSYSPNFLKYALWAQNKKMERDWESNELNVFDKIEGYFQCELGLTDDEIVQIMGYASVYGIKEATKKFDLNIPNYMVENFGELIKANDVLHEGPEKLSDCEESLSCDVNEAIKLLKHEYSLSEEQIKILREYKYFTSNELIVGIRGDCNPQKKEIRVLLKENENLRTIIHEMIHALGVKEEGLTELLAQKVYMKYVSIVSERTRDPFDMDLSYSSSSFEDPLSPGYFRSWAYFDISDRYRQLFRTLREVNLEKEIIDMVLSGTNIETALKLCFGPLESIDSFLEATTEMQRATYDRIYNNKEQDTVEEEKQCDRALFSFSTEGVKSHEISNISKFLRELKPDSTLEDFLITKDKIFEKIFENKSDYVRQNIHDGQYGWDFYDSENRLYAEEKSYVKKQLEFFQEIIDVIANKCEIPRGILKTFLGHDVKSITGKRFTVIGENETLYKSYNGDTRRGEKLDYLSQIFEDGDESVGFSLETVDLKYNSFGIAGWVCEFLKRGVKVMGAFPEAIRVGKIAISPYLISEQDFDDKRIFDKKTKLKDIATKSKVQTRNKEMDR